MQCMYPSSDRRRQGPSRCARARIRPTHRTCTLAHARRCTRTRGAGHEDKDGCVRVPVRHGARSATWQTVLAVPRITTLRAVPPPPWPGRRHLQACLPMDWASCSVLILRGTLLPPLGPGDIARVVVLVLPAGHVHRGPASPARVCPARRTGGAGRVPAGAPGPSSAEHSSHAGHKSWAWPGGRSPGPWHSRWAGGMVCCVQEVRVLYRQLPCRPRMRSGTRGLRPPHAPRHLAGREESPRVSNGACVPRPSTVCGAVRTGGCMSVG